MSVMTQTNRLIGDEGTTFTRSFVNYSLCCPSRATLYTGQYAHNHGVLGNGPPLGGYTRLDKTNWLPLWLQAAGYRTMHLGKFLTATAACPRQPRCRPLNDGTDDRPLDVLLRHYTVNENGTLGTYARPTSLSSTPPISSPGARTS